ncbi:MAG: 1,4-dihydroxy-2-naphthoate polyprenyltransferase, partial [Thermoleophilaceae bacterium]
PVLVGSGVAWPNGFRADVFAAALAAAVLIQIGTNYANDRFDFTRGADRPERLGPPRLAALGLATERELASATAIAFGLAALVGLYLVALGGVPILLVGLASIAAGLAYTAGPYPLGYHGLGDLFVFVFFGLVPLPAMEYLHTGTVTALAFVAAIPVGCVVTAIVVVNNLRDIDEDRSVAKRTFAVVLGRTGTRVWYSVLLVIAYAALPVAWALDLVPATALLPALTAPLAIRLGEIVSHREGAPLNEALRGTGQLHLLFGALLAIGLVVRA